MSDRPLRMCAACRQRASRDALLRYALVDGRVVFDPDRRIRGRGVNLGPGPVCLERAQKRGVFQRQWRVALSPEDARVLAAGVFATLTERLACYLTNAWRRGGLRAAASIDEVVPPEARILWERDELRDVVAEVPPAAAATPRMSAKIAALVRAVAQFSESRDGALPFARAGDMRRRPEPADTCPALTQDAGLEHSRVEDEAPDRRGGPGGRRPPAAPGREMVSKVAREAGGPVQGRPSGGSE